MQIFNTKPFTFFVYCLHCWQNRLQKMDNGQNKTCISLATRITPIAITGRHFVHYFKVASYSGDKTNYTHTYTHTCLTTLCPGLHRWAGTRKVKPIWILLKQKTVSSSGISWAICKSAPCSRQTTTPAPHHSFFTGRMPFLPPNQSTEGTR